MNHAASKTLDDLLDDRRDAPTVRVTVPVRMDVLETFKRLAAAGSMSTGRAMGDWLADTVEAATFMADKMEQARAAPRIVAREMHAYALGLADETGSLLERVRVKGRQDRTAARQSGAGTLPGGPADQSPPSCNTGGKVPRGKGKARGGKS